MKRADIVQKHQQFDTTDELAAWGFSADREFGHNPHRFLARGMFDYWTPFTQYDNDKFAGLGAFEAAEIMSLPTSKGWYLPGLGQTGYFGFCTTSPSFRSEREARFMEWLRPWIEDYEKEWGKLTKECLELTRPFREADFSKYSDMDLMKFFENEYYEMQRRIWIIHNIALYAVDSGYVAFERFMIEQVGINDKDSLFQALVTGFENRFDETNRKLWGIARRVKELGLERFFLETPPQLIPSKRNESQEMRQIFDEIDAFLETDGWRSESVHEFSATPWWDDLTPVMRTIVSYTQVSGEFPGDVKRRESTKEREEAIATVKQRLTTSELKRHFDLLLPIAQKAAVNNEEHTFYCEFNANTATYKLIKEIGKRFVEAGALDEWTDTWYLLPDEIMYSLIPRYEHNLKGIAERRKRWHKAKIEAEQTGQLPPILGELVPVEDVVLAKTVGMGEEIKPQKGAVVCGLPASPGVAEGYARIVMDVSQIGEIKPGEILICPYTNAPFAGVFSIINAAVTDTGGMLCHAAICAREARIPAIVMARDATLKIRTGQRIEVDGNKGAVYILDK